MTQASPEQNRPGVHLRRGVVRLAQLRVLSGPLTVAAALEAHFAVQEAVVVAVAATASGRSKTLVLNLGDAVRRMADEIDAQEARETVAGAALDRFLASWSGTDIVADTLAFVRREVDESTFFTPGAALAYVIFARNGDDTLHGRVRVEAAELGAHVGLNDASSAINRVELFELTGIAADAPRTPSWPLVLEHVRRVGRPCPSEGHLVEFAMPTP